MDTLHKQKTPLVTLDDIKIRLSDGLVQNSSRTEIRSRLPGSFRHAAVLLLLVWNENEWNLVFTRRTELVQDHKGQVAFPGGAVEEQDVNLQSAALREAEEEIGLTPEDVEILGQMDPMLTISGFLVTPVVGSVNWPYPLKPSPAEVERIFTIPLSWLADPANYDERIYYRPAFGGSEEVIFYHPYDGEILWGISGRITLLFLKVIGLGLQD